MAREGALKVKAQLYWGDERALGPGRADVLEAIEREGSIRAAGRSLGMSYRYVWLLVDSMNRCFREKLIESATGGARGGGTGLTDTGKQVLAAYRALERLLMSTAEGEPLAILNALLNDLPTKSPD